MIGISLFEIEPFDTDDMEATVAEREKSNLQLGLNHRGPLEDRKYVTRSDSSGQDEKV